jgi:hypothetical protein
MLSVTYLNPPTDSSQDFQMESCAMVEPPKFEINFWGVKVSAQGLAGIAAAVLVVGMFLAVSRY